MHHVVAVPQSLSSDPSTQSTNPSQNLLSGLQSSGCKHEKKPRGHTARKRSDKFGGGIEGVFFTCCAPVVACLRLYFVQETVEEAQWTYQSEDLQHIDLKQSSSANIERTQVETM